MEAIDFTRSTCRKNDFFYYIRLGNEVSYITFDHKCSKRHQTRVGSWRLLSKSHKYASAQFPVCYLTRMHFSCGNLVTFSFSFSLSLCLLMLSLMQSSIRLSYPNDTKCRNGRKSTPYRYEHECGEMSWQVFIRHLYSLFGMTLKRYQK